MKKNIIKSLASVIMITLLFFGGCSHMRPPMGDSLFFLFYEPAGIISTARKDGCFFVMEKPVQDKWEHGTIKIYLAYYDDYFINIDAIIETDAPEELERLANSEDRSLYPEVKVDGFKVKLASSGINSRSSEAEEQQTNMSRYRMRSSYCFTGKKINNPIKVKFQNIILEIPMIEKQGSQEAPGKIIGYSLDPDTQTELLQKYKDDMFDNGNVQQ